MLDSLDLSRGLYVLKHGSGYTCLGFDVAFRHATAWAAWAGVPLPDLALRGTKAGYLDYERCMNAASAHAAATGTRCSADLHPQLIGMEGRRVEVVSADGETYRFQVGKSTGWFPCHLHLARSNCRGGHPIGLRPFQSVRIVR